MSSKKRTRYRLLLDEGVHLPQSYPKLVVFNVKDFKKFISADSPSVIALSSNLPDKQADLKICKALRNLNPSQRKGHLISISISGIRIEEITPEES